MELLFLVDGDNNLPNALNGIEMLTEEDKILIFHGKGMNLTKAKSKTDIAKATVQYIESVKDGKNSIDFQIITELGVLVGKGEVDFAYIISSDKGYAASTQLLKKRYAALFNEVDVCASIEACFKLPFILKAQTEQSLYAALEKEFGNAHGTLVFEHLKQLFSKRTEPIYIKEEKLTKPTLRTVEKEPINLFTYGETEEETQFDDNYDNFLIEEDDALPF